MNLCLDYPHTGSMIGHMSLSWGTMRLFHLKFRLGLDTRHISPIKDGLSRDWVWRVSILQARRQHFSKGDCWMRKIYRRAGSSRINFANSKFYVLDNSEIFSQIKKITGNIRKTMNCAIADLTWNLCSTTFVIEFHISKIILRYNFLGIKESTWETSGLIYSNVNIYANTLMHVNIYVIKHIQANIYIHACI